MTTSPVDLDFRPDYHSPADALAAILANVKGQRRRELIRDIASGHAREAVLKRGGDPALAELLSEVDPGLLVESFDDPGKLAWLNPTFLGGECLPAYLPGEVEVARVVMETTTMDVVSIRARRRTRGYRFRVVDEYEAVFRFAPKSSRLPLTLGEMVEFVFRYDYEDTDPGPTGERGAILGRLDWDLGNGVEAEELRGFHRVESDFYPGMDKLVTDRIDEWLDRRVGKAGA